MNFITLENEPMTCGPDGCRKPTAAAGGSSEYSNQGVGQTVRLPIRPSEVKPTKKTKPVITLDIVSDILCPWCYYGKRGLDVAMAKAGDDFDFAIRWHPFFIRPNIPRPGRTPAESGIGSVERPYFHYMKDRVARDYPGLLKMDGRCDKYPNTILAHSALLWALHTDPSKQHELMERIFAAFYSQNRFVGSIPVLLELIAEAGYTNSQVAAAKTWLETGAGESTVKAQAERSSRNGLSGVPDFTLTHENGVKTELHGGAHYSTFLAAFAQLAGK